MDSVGKKIEFCQREYAILIFHHDQRTTSNSYCLKIDFVMTWNTKAHVLVSACVLHVVYSDQSSFIISACMCICIRL